MEPKAHWCRSREVPYLFGRRHRKEHTHRRHPKHGFALDIAFFADFDKIEKQRACHFRPQVTADKQVRLQSSSAGLRFKTQRVLRATGHPIVNVGAEVQRPSVCTVFDVEFYREERSIIDSDAALLDRCNEEVAVAFAL